MKIVCNKRIIFVWISILGIFGLFFALIRFFPYTIPPLKESRVYTDRYGTIFAEEWDVYGRHQTIAPENIPLFFKQALITLEDRSFFSNIGISPKGILRALLADLKASSVVQGGSTLSMQLVRNIDGTTNNRSIFRKLKEMIDAIRLNISYSKEEILTEYINRVAFTNLDTWLASASYTFFSKDPNMLTRAEQIALLVLPKNPKLYHPVMENAAFRGRFETIVHSLSKESLLSQSEVNSILSEPLIWKRPKTPMPYARDYLEGLVPPEKSGRIETTFDIPLSNRIDTLAKSVLLEIGWKNVNDYGVYVIDRKNSEIRTMIGGINYGNAEDGQVNSVTSPRQVGSTLKPFLYALAFKKFHLHENDQILDLPVSYKTADGFAYEPKNYSKTFKWSISYGEALAESINIPAVKLLERVGVSEFLLFLRSLGITTLTKDADFYGLSLALGTGEISLKELTDAYSVFANSGSACTSGVFKDIPKTCSPKIDTDITSEIVQILSSRANKMGSFPIGSALDFENAHVFVKTGTSRNFRDNWTVGVSDNYIIGVWTGNKNAENMHGVSGASGAGEIFARIVRDIDPSTQDKKEILSPKIIPPFLAITSPLEKSVYKTDASRPLSLQWIEMKYQTNIPFEKSTWTLDGAIFTGKTLPLIKGKHVLRLELQDGSDSIKTVSVSYEVQE